MMKSINLGVVGATGLVGESLVKLLEERKFPAKSLQLFASERTAGTSLMFNKSPVLVRKLDEVDFSTMDLVIFVATDAVSKEHIPRAQASDCWVIDNSQAFADGFPLLVPGVNVSDRDKESRTVVNPDSSALVLATLVQTLLNVGWGVRRMDATVCQSVASLGKKAIHELASQTASLLNGRGAQTQFFPSQIAFNLHPYSGDLDDLGVSSAERRIVAQLQRILPNSEIAIDVTCIQAPVFYADSLSVKIHMDEIISVDSFIDLMGQNPSVKVMNGILGKNCTTPVDQSKESQKVLMSRVRRDIGDERALNVWLTVDSVKYSAALNTILLAEELIKHDL